MQPKAFSMQVLQQILRHARLEATQEAGFGTGGGTVTLSRLLGAYGHVLQSMGILAEGDTHYYRLVLKLSLQPDHNWDDKLAALRRDLLHRHGQQMPLQPCNNVHQCVKGCGRSFLGDSVVNQPVPCFEKAAPGAVPAPAVPQRHKDSCYHAPCAGQAQSPHGGPAYMVHDIASRADRSSLFTPSQAERGIDCQRRPSHTRHMMQRCTRQHMLAHRRRHKGQSVRGLSCCHSSYQTSETATARELADTIASAWARAMQSGSDQRIPCSWQHVPQGQAPEVLHHSHLQRPVLAAWRTAAEGSSAQRRQRQAAAEQHYHAAMLLRAWRAWQMHTHTSIEVRQQADGLAAVQHAAQLCKAGWQAWCACVHASRQLSAVADELAITQLLRRYFVRWQHACSGALAILPHLVGQVKNNEQAHEVYCRKGGSWAASTSQPTSPTIRAGVEDAAHEAGESAQPPSSPDTITLSQCAGGHNLASVAASQVVSEASMSDAARQCLQVLFALPAG